MTNVKPGYLAYVVGPMNMNHGHLVGAVVEVLRLCRHGDLFTAVDGFRVAADMTGLDGVYWICRSRTPLLWADMNGQFRFHLELPFWDTRLRPIWGPDRVVEDGVLNPMVDSRV